MKFLWKMILLPVLFVPLLAGAASLLRIYP